MRFLSVSLDSFLIEFQDLSETTHFFRHVQRQMHPAIVDMIPAEKTILIQFSVFKTSQQQLITWLSQQHIQHENVVLGHEVVIDVDYRGEDLNQVAELLGVSVAEVIRRHTESEWKVAFIGFAPGFGYISCDDRPFGSIPRLSSPRKKITAGSVALAGEYTGVYPKDSPGGWQLIGQTHEAMWDTYREPPALLLPGNTVVFQDVKKASRVMVSTPAQKPIQALATITVEASQALTVIHAGMQTLVQDQGRLGQFSLGVGEAGALDRVAMHDANACVGNALDAAVLEILNGDFKAKVEQAIVFAVAGAVSDIVLEYADGTVATVTSGQAIALDAGDTFYIKRPQAGLRHYLALRGGIIVAPVLGSCSFDSLADLGPRPLQSGDLVMLGQGAQQAVGGAMTARHLPRVADVVVLDVVLGPRTDWFDAESIDVFLNQMWQVSADINRVGLRLLGDVALKRQHHAELASEGTVTGALQIPPNGQPVLFMNDHPLTGGYPIIAVVADYHLDVVAQIPAGCSIKFNQISAFMDVNV